MFDTLFNTIFPAIGQFFSGLVYLATMKFSTFVSFLTAPATTSHIVTNFMTGEPFVFSMGSITALINSLTNSNIVAIIIADIILGPVMLAEFLLGSLFGWLSTVSGLGDLQTWIAFLIFAGSSFVPIIVIKVVRKIFW